MRAKKVVFLVNYRIPFKINDLRAVKRNQLKFKKDLRKYEYTFLYLYLLIKKHIGLYIRALMSKLGLYIRTNLF